MDERAKAAMAQFRAAARAGKLKIEYAGRDEEIKYLRSALLKVDDAETRERMQERLAYVESRTNEELMEDFFGPEPEGN